MQTYKKPCPLKLNVPILARRTSRHATEVSGGVERKGHREPCKISLFSHMQDFAANTKDIDTTDETVAGGNGPRGLELNVAIFSLAGLRGRHDDARHPEGDPRALDGGAHLLGARVPRRRAHVLRPVHTAAHQVLLLPEEGERAGRGGERWGGA